MFSRIPLALGEPTMIAAPLFHSWGFAHFMLGLALNSTYVLQRRFDPEATLKAIEEHEADGARGRAGDDAADPPAPRRDARPSTTCRACGSPPPAVRRCPGELATKWMDHFGDNLYNLYGSTEVAWATIATPEDLREAPGTAGRPPRGTVVKIVDENGKPSCRRARRAGSSSATRWPSRATPAAAARSELEGLLSSGDVGHFDDGGRLFIDGRDDEMIVSGGENVFPREVEDLLADHDEVKEVAVIGVDDDEFGQRLKAFVVARPARAPSTRTRSRATSSRTSPATRSRARSSSSTRCRATPPARSSSASSPEPAGRRLRSGYSPGHVAAARDHGSAPAPRGFHLVGDEVLGALPEIAELEVGVLHLSDPPHVGVAGAEREREPGRAPRPRDRFERRGPRGRRLLAPQLEGADDMPAHVKATLIGPSLSLPVRDGALALGTWQGIYLCEHRDSGGPRRIVATLNGE